MLMMLDQNLSSKLVSIVFIFNALFLEVLKLWAFHSGNFL